MNLQEIRIRKGFTQKQVADVIGCLPSVYSRYETGVREPSVAILKELASLFGVSVDELVGYDAPKNSGLSEYETALIAAAREADERACQDALSMLQSHRVERKKGKMA